MQKGLRLTELLKEDEPKKGSSKFPGKFHLGGGYYSSKEAGDAEFKSEDGKLRPLTPDEKAAKKAEKTGGAPKPAAQPKAAPASQGAAAARAGAKPQAEPAKPAQTAQPKEKPAQPKPAAPKPVEEPLMGPEEKKAHAEYEHEKEGLDHDEKEAYEFLDNIPAEEQAAAIDKALNNRSWWQKFSQDTVVGGFLKKKGNQFKEAGKGIASLFRHRKTGVVKDCSGAPAGPHAKKSESIERVMEAPKDRQAYLQSLGKDGKPKSSEPVDQSKCKDTHYTDYMKRDENGKPMYEEKEEPVYKQGKKPDPGDVESDDQFSALKGKGIGFTRADIDPKTGFYKKDDKYYDKSGAEVDKKGNLLGKDGKPQQEKSWLGKPKTKKTEVPVYEDNLTPEQLEAAHESHHASHEQLHAIKHTAMEIGVIAVSVVAGPYVVGHQAAAAGAEAAHGFGTVVAHTLKDIAKHAAAEIMGAPDAFTAGGAGLALSAATGGILENRRNFLMMLEQEGSMDPNSAFVQDMLKKTLERMKTFKMTPQQKLDSIKSYKEKKAEEKAKKGEEDKSIKESVFTTSRVKEIANFVEYAAKRLKLEEKPKIKLVKEAEYLENEIIKDGSSALGGYIPTEKTIMVVNDGRLIADVLRTIAHEMVHHKQNEMGVLKNLEEAGKAGTKFENQANSIAGILIREYGKTNKKIYNESKMFFSETEQINMAIQNEINKLKTKY